MLKTVIHEDDVVGEFFFGDLGGGNSVVADDQGDVGQKFAEHCGFIAPFGDVQGADGGEGCALVFG